MKKTIAFMMCLALFCALICGCGIKKDPVSDTVSEETETAQEGTDGSVVRVSDTVVALFPEKEFAGKKLLEFMEREKELGNLEFTVANGMITSVNGVKNADDYSSCWMLYTDDSENSNEAWGTKEYAGKIYASASLGADALEISENCSYLWVFVTF